MLANRMRMASASIWAKYTANTSYGAPYSNDDWYDNGGRTHTTTDVSRDISETVWSSFSWNSSSAYVSTATTTIGALGVGGTFYSRQSVGSDEAVAKWDILSISGSTATVRKWMYWRICDTTTNYSKGSYITDVTDADPNKYPINGYSNGYWYVKQ